MNLAFSRIRQIFKKFGQKQYTYEDFLRICRRERINIGFRDDLPTAIKGYYLSELRRVYRKKWIVLNDKLSPEERLYVAFHELVHHFLHSSYTNRELFYCRAKNLQDSAQDAEAEAIALVMILPAQKLLELMNTPFEEIRGFSTENLIKRKRIFERNDFGVHGNFFLPFDFN